MIGWGSWVGRALRARRTDGSENRPYPLQPRGGWSRLPKAERLTPEGLMPRWPAPDTFKKMPEAYFPVSGLPSAVSFWSTEPLGHRASSFG